MRIPLTSPTSAATQRARCRSPRPDALVRRVCPAPTVTTAARVRVPGTLRSMPPVMITSIWPSAVMARNVPNGAIALRRRSPSRSPAPRSRRRRRAARRDVHRQVAGGHHERGERRRRGLPGCSSAASGCGADDETGGGGDALPRGRRPGPGRAARPPARTPSRIRTRPAANTQSTLDVSMPQTTAPIGSLIGKMLGRSVRSTTTSACLPGSSEPVTPPRPATRAPSDGGVADHVPRAHELWAAPALPASLRSNTVACCSEIVARIWANMSPGATRSSSTPSPGRMSRSISSWIGGDPEAARHLARGRQRDASPRRSDRVEVGVVEPRNSARA